MIPVILTGGSQSDRTTEVARLFPPSVYAYTHVVADERSIGISQIQGVVKNVSVTSAIQRVIWIEEAGTMTIAAQNALLKVLEEPPSSTQFVLTVENARVLLATVRSRCITKTVIQEASPVTDDFSLLKKAISMSQGDRIIAANSIGRKREVATAWVLDSMRGMERRMKNENSPKSLAILTQISLHLETAYTDLHANVSVALAMQNLFIHLPRSSQ